MNKRPSQTFLILAFIMVVLLVAGLIAVWELAKPQTGGDNWTVTAIISTNNFILTMFARATESPGPEIANTLTSWASHIYAISTSIAADTATAFATRAPAVLTETPASIDRSS